MTESFLVENRLGYRILRWVLLTALAAGIMLSAMQVIFDAQRVSEELNQNARQTLALVRDAATQAVYSIDEDLARQVVDGLFKQAAVRFASIRHPDGTILAERTRPLETASYRSITDVIFKPERTYSVPLIKNDPQPVTYGTLEIRLDTVHTARLWLERATLTLLSGVARALILGLALYLVYHWLLNRPLMRIIESVAAVDPENPGEHLLKTPGGHQGDELDIWVKGTNNLLRSIADSQKKQWAAEARITRLSRYDHLTGLPNRAMLLSLLTSALDDSRRREHVVAIYCCGLDDFKGINDQYGYRAGDRLLQSIADRLAIEHNDVALVAARLSGDQFVIVEQRLKDGYQAAATAEWLLREISRPTLIGDREVSTTATIGISLFPGDAHEADKLLQQAEQTMTLAKAAGRNRFQFYVASIDREIRERKQLERDLSKALSGNQFHLVYQPQINLEMRRVIGAEALIRWKHPERGLIPPDQFIPLAELNHSIIEIGNWVLDQACQQAAAWSEKGMPIRIAVNLSAVQLRQDDIVEQVLEVLKRHSLPPNRLELEVTETSFMESLDEAVDKLTKLRNEGIQIAVDDFGTGYSSLTYLKRLPVQHLKIDKQFIHDLLVNDEDTRIANTIIDLGKSLNLDVVAEGVETEEQEVYLRTRGCMLAQGYLFSKPLPSDIFETFVTEFHKSRDKTELPG